MVEDEEEEEAVQAEEGEQWNRIASTVHFVFRFECSAASETKQGTCLKDKSPIRPVQGQCAGTSAREP